MKPHSLLNYHSCYTIHTFHFTNQSQIWNCWYTISDTARREVLHRLLALNHARYAEEVAAGVHDKKKGKKTGKKGKKKDESGQKALL